MPRFAKLAVTTVAATYLLIALGGFVRAMEAGLGCPDWPTCHGSLNPPGSLRWGELRLAWIEHSHRLWAAVVIVLVVALAVAARRTGQPRPVRLAAYWLVPAVLSQALLGAIVVWAKLDAESVTLHLAGALTVVGLGLYVVVRSTGAAPLTVTPKIARLARACAGLTFAQMLVGATVTGHHAGLAFTTFPLFQGRALPAFEAHFRPWLHATHRFVAYGLLVMVLSLALRARQTPLRGLAAAALGLVLGQVALGALNVWFALPAWSVVPHLAVGSWLWGVLLVATLRTLPRPAEVTETVPAVGRGGGHVVVATP